MNKEIPDFPGERPRQQVFVDGQDDNELSTQIDALVALAQSEPVDVLDGNFEGEHGAFTIPQGATAEEIEGLYRAWFVENFDED